MIETKDMGKCYRKKDGYALYKDEMGFVGVYSIFQDEGKEVAVHRGYLAHPENFEMVVEELKYEAKIAIQELREEFGMTDVGGMK